MCNNVEEMSDVVLARAKRLNRTWLRDHLPDMCVVLLITFLLWGIFRHRSPNKAQISLVVVSKASGLAPFEVIRKEDVTLRNGAPNSSAFTSVNDVLGRYAIQYIPKDAILEGTQVSAGAQLSNEMDRRQILALKLQPSTILVGVRPPIKIGLLASPREKDHSAVFINDVYLLDFHSQADGISAVLAISDSDLKTLSPLISRSDLIAIAPSR